mgnify:CR=1 FL=1|tara:strand:- start:547 stop:4398 length:3852 start_codon:yes stop_codon:yes gene_type:complete
MAEHNIIRRVGGDLETHRSPSGRRILLPSEIELCETLGLSEEDYWYFVRVTESYNGKRSKAYDHIPHVVNNPVQIITQLVIGIVLTYVSVLLSPKPRPQKHETPGSLTTAGAQGPKRFAPQTGFGSVQELANLGDVIPLVFTNTEENPNGGVRINSKLLWSQMRSLFTGQQLRGLFLFSSGQLGAMPDYEGFAIGDTTLANYTSAKVALYFMTDGGRPQEFTPSGGTGNKNERYNRGTLTNWPDGDAFSVWWDRMGSYESKIFSGTRTPGTQTQFGAFAPFPNGTAYKVPYELVLKGKDAKSDVKADIDKKRNKISAKFPRYSSIRGGRKASGSTISVSGGQKTLNIYKDYELDYKIHNDNPTKSYGSKYDPWGVEDVKSSVDATRITSDSNLSKGDTYLVGSALMNCKHINYTPDTGIWTPLNGAEVVATFRATEDGGKAQIVGANATEDPYRTLVIQRCAIGTVSGNTLCDVTEIGLKSTVWKQITGFANVNGHPGHIKYGQPGTVKKYEDDNGSIQLGQMSKYIKRISFFRLQGRIAGKNNDWKYIDGGKPFAVRGNTPQPQYNFIRINHSSDKQYEFRFIPYPGNLAQREFINKDVHLFVKNNTGYIESGEFDIYYSGQLTQLTGNLMSNSEWYLGALPAFVGSAVTGLSKSTQGSIPTHKDWVKTSSNIFKQRANGAIETGCVFGARTGKYAVSRLEFKGAGSNKFLQTEWEWWRRNSNPPYIGHTPPLPKGLNNADSIIDNASYAVFSGGKQYRAGTYVSTSGYTKTYKLNVYEMRDVPDKSYPVSSSVSTSSDRNGTGLTLRVTVYKNKAVIWSINNAGVGYRTGDRVTFNVPHVGGNISFNVETDSGALVTDKERNLNIYDAVADYYKYDAEQSSHLTGPEHEIVYVNEQAINSNGASYGNLAIAGLRLNSAKEWTSFSQLSAYIKKGVKVDRLIESGEGSTNLFPEIAYALLTDSEIGAGDLIGVTSVDKDKMTVAAKFCKANGFFWDGVITQSQNLREFIFTQAAYCFLDFTIIGGRFSLYPSVPFNSQYKINYDAKPEVRALFTDGNIKDLKVSFLSPEERQVFQARVLWRKETINGFSQTNVEEVRLSDNQGGSNTDPRETFDMSIFCTNGDHASTFAKYALRTRQMVDHGLTFQTTPQAAMFMRPGEYFRLYSESTHTSRFANGVITDGGVIQSSSHSYSNGDSIYYWKPGQSEVKGPTPLSINGGLADAAFRGCVFTIAQTNSSDRVYKLESLTFAEDGLVEVAGSYVPLESDGTFSVLQGYDDPEQFV